MEGANFGHVFDELFIWEGFKVPESAFHERFELITAKAVEITLSARQKGTVSAFGAIRWSFPTFAFCARENCGWRDIEQIADCVASFALLPKLANERPWDIGAWRERRAHCVRA